MKIKNMTGTSDATCGCGPWLKHWEKFSGQAAKTCSVPGCRKTDLVGAHVKKVGSSDHDSYICPLCKDHNKSTDVLEIPDAVKLAPAKKKETCGK